MDPQNSTSVQIKAVESSGPHIRLEPVREAVLRLLDRSGISTSVQLAAINTLGAQVSRPDVRSIIAAALRHENSTSVQLKAVDALEGQVGQTDVQRALIGTLHPRYSTSVVLASLRALEGQARTVSEVRNAFLGTMEEEEISSSARIAAADAVVEGATTREKVRIADAMEDVIIRVAGQRFRSWPRDTIEAALKVVEKVDRERAAELRRRYGRPPSLLQRLLDPPPGPVVPEAPSAPATPAYGRAGAPEAPPAPGPPAIATLDAVTLPGAPPLPAMSGITPPPVPPPPIS
jgi:hypothetical protein